MDDPDLRLLKAQLACEAALKDRRRREHQLKMAKMENDRLRHAVALLKRETGRLQDEAE
jgi:hypothetical protein